MYIKKAKLKNELGLSVHVSFNCLDDIAVVYSGFCDQYPNSLHHLQHC